MYFHGIKIHPKHTMQDGHSARQAGALTPQLCALTPQLCSLVSLILSFFFSVL